ncbi:hypothetical protein E2542_SST03500 [Spatholobus suberectus]|nr:hypothetical protein E2542_SST03500 [Spatholobus suberectus]
MNTKAFQILTSHRRLPLPTPDLDHTLYFKRDPPHHHTIGLHVSTSKTATIRKKIAISEEETSPRHRKPYASYLNKINPRYIQSHPPPIVQTQFRSGHRSQGSRLLTVLSLFILHWPFSRTPRTYNRSRHTRFRADLGRERGKPRGFMI